MSGIVRFKEGETFPRQQRKRAVERVGASGGESPSLDSLARAVARLSSVVDALASSLPPRASEYEFNSFAGTAADILRCEHRFGGDVRWWICSPRSNSTVYVTEHADTTDDVLVLSMDNTIDIPSRIIIRVEAVE